MEYLSKFMQRNAAQLFMVSALFLPSCSSDQMHDNRGQPSPQAQGSDAQKGTPAVTADSIIPSANSTPTPPPGSALRLSGGSGGKTGEVEEDFEDTQGTVSSYKINAPQDTADGKVYGLHIHFHGDGGGGYVDFPNHDTKDNLIGVTVKAPNTALTWGRQQGVAHAKYVQELIQNELLKKYNIDLDRVYFSGVSGGSYFLSGHFIPTFGSFYKTGAFLMCGGMAPQVTFKEVGFLSSFRIHWEITAGERNDIKASVRQSIAGYKRELDALAGVVSGIETNNEEGPGGHCEFDGVDYTSGIQFMMDEKFSTILK